MVLHRSLDEVNIIAAALHDVYMTHGVVFNYTAYRNTLTRVKRQVAMEGVGFLTKTLPRLGKALDKAMSGNSALNASELRFKPQNGSKLPRFLGELFNKVLSKDGVLLPNPCADCVNALRQILFVFYKEELSYAEEQELRVTQQFVKTEEQLTIVERELGFIQALLDDTSKPVVPLRKEPSPKLRLVRRARNLLTRLFRSFDPTDITPQHGPGTVATKQRNLDKYLWSNVSSRITEVYPFDAYFMASSGHVCDSYRDLESLSEESLPARVCLVPKDSRGPRLISCEPVDYQWVQQGLGRAIVKHVEKHPLTKWNIRYTDQQPNQLAALLGSLTGKYATLDLNEASDRVSVALVRLLFPPDLYRYLEACRSLSTKLPDGSELTLQKYAPMGSSLCFPVLAITIWAILTAAASDTDTRESIYVYGDDVIVPTAFAVDAMEQLESFGLKINRDKSCIGGLFRESCGMDAFNGVPVMPVRIRTPWSSSQSPEAYSSWVAYANSFYEKQYFSVYEKIVEGLVSLYGPIPTKDQVKDSAPSLYEVPPHGVVKKTRINPHLQKREWYVRVLHTPTLQQELPGWSKLLRYFTETKMADPNDSGSFWNPDESLRFYAEGCLPSGKRKSSAVSMYTRRDTSILVYRWR